MSENTPSGGDENSSNQPDPINNIKQEFGRKLGNVETQVAALTEANKQLLAQLQNMTTPKANQAPAVQEDDIEDLWYKNPREAAARIAKAAEDRIEAKLTQRAAASNKSQQTLSGLVREYPELNDDAHPLTKRAVEIYNGLDESDKSSPMAYKLAVKEAATELEVKPVNKRSNYDDNYSMSSGGSSDYRREGRSSKKDEVDPATIAFAKMLGRPIDDPKYMERLKNASKRKNWNKYE